jgi:hypothetical protein
MKRIVDIITSSHPKGIVALDLDYDIDSINYPDRRHLYFCIKDILYENDWCMVNNNLIRYKKELELINPLKVIASTDNLNLPKPSKEFINNFITYNPKQCYIEFEEVSNTYGAKVKLTDNFINVTIIPKTYSKEEVIVLLAKILNDMSPENSEYYLNGNKSDLLNNWLNENL